MKKILFIIFCFILVSCASLKSSETAYNRGDYVSSVEYAVDYVNRKGFNSLKEDEKNSVIMRFRNINDIYKQKLSIKSDYIYLDELDYFKILYIISTNNELRMLLNEYNVNDSQYYFNLAMNDIKKMENRYISNNDRSSVLYLIKSLDRTTDFINSNNLKNNYQYSILMNSYFKEISNMYTFLAKYDEKNNSLESARDYYLLAYNSYKSYDENYNNNYNNYTRLDKRLKYAKAEYYIQKAEETNLKADFISSSKYYKEAIDLLSRYENYFRNELQNLRLKYSTAKQNADKQIAQQYFNEATTLASSARTSADYRKVADLYKKASSYVNNYQNSLTLANNYYQKAVELEKQNQNNKNNYNYNNNYNNYDNKYNSNNKTDKISYTNENYRNLANIKQYLNDVLRAKGYNQNYLRYSEVENYYKNTKLVESRYNLNVYEVTEILEIVPKILYNNNSYYDLNTITYENKYKIYRYNDGKTKYSGQELGYYELLSKYSNDIDYKVNNMIYNLYR